MGKLIQTLLEITLLRKGPEALPTSWLLFGVTVVLRFAAVILSVVVIEEFTAEFIRLDIVVWLVGLVCFGGLLMVIGKERRLAATLTALVGVGAIITLAMSLVVLIGGMLLTDAAVTTAVQLIVLWSVIVKGHIMARATGWHWYAGLLVSIAVLVLQLVASQA